jgi:hypothetical protein
MPCWAVAAGIGLAVVLVLLLIPYYVCLVRTILAMLRRPASPVVLAFALLALIPLPPLILLGILLMVIWRKYEKTS